jgi:hypothetical protein
MGEVICTPLLAPKPGLDNVVKRRRGRTGRGRAGQGGGGKAGEGKAGQGGPASNQTKIQFF